MAQIINYIYEGQRSIRVYPNGDIIGRCYLDLGNPSGGYVAAGANFSFEINGVAVPATYSINFGAITIALSQEQAIKLVAGANYQLKCGCDSQWNSDIKQVIGSDVKLAVPSGVFAGNGGTQSSTPVRFATCETRTVQATSKSRLRFGAGGNVGGGAGTAVGEFSAKGWALPQTGIINIESGGVSYNALTPSTSPNSDTWAMTNVTPNRGRYVLRDTGANGNVSQNVWFTGQDWEDDDSNSLTFDVGDEFIFYPDPNWVANGGGERFFALDFINVNQISTSGNAGLFNVTDDRTGTDVVVGATINTATGQDYLTLKATSTAYEVRRKNATTGANTLIYTTPRTVSYSISGCAGATFNSYTAGTNVAYGTSVVMNMAAAQCPSGVLTARIDDFYEVQQPFYCDGTITITTPSSLPSCWTTGTVVNLTAVGFNTGTAFTATPQNGLTLTGVSPDNLSFTLGTVPCVGATPRVVVSNNCNSETFTFNFNGCEPAATITPTNAVCSGSVIITDAKIAYSGMTNATHVHYTAGATYTGSFGSAIAISGGSGNVVTNLPNTTSQYTVRFFNGNANCYRDYTTNITASACCTAPSATVEIKSASCTNGIPNANAQIKYFGLSNATHIAWSTGGTFTGSFGSATAVSATNGTIVNNLVSNSGLHTVRIFNSGSTCFTDYTVNIGDACCFEPTATVEIKAASCIGLTPNNDAQIKYFGAVNVTHVGWSAGAIYTGGFSGAVAISATNGTVAFGLTNNSGQYTVRFYNTQAGCYNDYTVSIGVACCFVPSATVSATNATCTLGIANADARLDYVGMVNATHVGYSAGFIYTGGFSGATAISSSSGVIVNNLPNTATSYTVRFYNGNTGCYTDYTLAITSAPCCTAPSATVEIKAASCTSGTPNNNAQINYFGATNATHVHYTAGGTYTGSFSSATSIFSPAGSAAIGLVSNSGLYTVRFFNGGSTCYRDYTVTIGAACCVEPSGTVEIKAASCTNGVPNSNAMIKYFGMVNTDRIGYSAGAIYTGGYAGATAVSASNGTIAANLPSNSGLYTVRFYNGNTGCYNDYQVTIGAACCLEPVATVEIKAASCTSGVPNSDAKINYFGMVNATHVGYTAGAIYTGGFSGATAISATNGTIVANLVSNSGQYTVRFYNGNTGCYNDYTVTIGAACCLEPSATIEVKAASCTNGNPNADSKITYFGLVNTDRIGYTQGSIYTGGYAGATPVSTTFGNVGINLGSNSGTFTVRLYNGNTGCYKDYQVVIGAACCLAPTATVEIKAATCTSNIPNSDAMIKYFGMVNATHVGWSLGQVYTGGLSGATPISATSGNVVTGRPSSSGIYTVRFYNTQDSCYNDYQVTIGAACCLVPSATVEIKSASCTSGVPNSDAQIKYFGMVNTTHIGWSSGSIYTAGFSGATATSATNGTIVANLASNSGQYTVRFYNGNTGCYADYTVTIGDACCFVPSATVTPTNATCTGSSANADAKILYSGMVNATHMGYSVGSIYTGGFSGATAIVSSSGNVIINQPNTATQYTVRFYNTQAGCYSDYTVVIGQTSCCVTLPSATVTGTNAVCTSGVAGNASINYTGMANATHVHYTNGATYTGSFGSATAISSSSGSIATNLNNVTRQYTVRFFNGNADCFRDYTVSIVAANCCLTPIATVTPANAICSGGVVSTAAKITYTGMANATHVHYTSGATYTGNFGSATAISASAGNIALGLPNTTSQYTVRFFYGGSSCFQDYTVSISAITCCTTPTATVSTTSATCTSGVANANARIDYTNMVSATHVHYTTGATYTGSFSNATLISSVSGVVATGLPNADGQFTVRFFNGVSTCFVDYTVSISAITCTALPLPIANPFTVPPVKQNTVTPLVPTFSGSAPQGCQITGFRVVTLPPCGVLLLGDNPIAAGQIIPIGQVGNIKYNSLTCLSIQTFTYTAIGNTCGESLPATVILDVDLDCDGNGGGGGDCPCDKQPVLDLIDDMLNGLCGTTLTRWQVEAWLKAIKAKVNQIC